jgi:hypothetical protein
LWGGQHERPKSGTGGDTHPTRKFGMFFYLEVPNQDISASNFLRAEQLNVSKNMILLRNNP